MKGIVIKPKLTIALLLASLATIFSAIPVLAQATIFLQPRTSEFGDNIEVYGYGFTPSTSVYLYFATELAIAGNYIDTQVNTYERVKVAATDNESFLSTSFIVPIRLTGGSTERWVRNGTYYVYVTYAGDKQIRAGAQFTVENIGEIILARNIGTVGTEVRIKGADFGYRESITVKYDDETIPLKSGDDATDNNGDFLLTISIPKSTVGEHTITVTGSNTLAKAEAKFTVQTQITISPQSGAGGDIITVSGTGFGNRVKFNISFDSLAVVTNALTDSTGSFQVKFTAPSVGEGSHDLEVKDEAGNADKGAFTLAPVAIRLSAASGFVGFEISISGSGFRNNGSLSILLGETLVKTATTDDYGQFTTKFNVPAKPGGNYKVKASDGVSTSQADFYLAPNADISPMTTHTSPGYVATEITINGTGFLGEKTASITYDGNQIKTATINSNGSFSVTFKIPASGGGEHKIIFTDGANTKQFTFIMESTAPPTPAPLKPEMSRKTKAETYFDWADVTDPSGVTYTLQIATNKDFTKDSLVLEKTGLTPSEYTLTQEEGLKPREKDLPYYWHVKTVDNAANESQWTGTGTFYVGFVLSITPSIIYTILVIVAFLLGILGFWLGRRTTYH